MRGPFKGILDSLECSSTYPSSNRFKTDPVTESVHAFSLLGFEEAPLHLPRAWPRFFVFGEFRVKS